MLPLVRDGAPLWLAAGAWAVVAFETGVDSALLVSFRQRVTPDRLSGRMNASFPTALTGALAIGSAITGLLGELAGTRACPWAGAVALTLVWVPIARSPPRTMRDLPREPAARPTEPEPTEPRPTKTAPTKTAPTNAPPTETPAPDGSGR